MVILHLIMGIALVTTGRRLFWLFVGIVGFIFSMEVARSFFYYEPDEVILIIALIAGLVGAGLAYILQKSAVVVVGIFAGAYIFMNLFAVLQIGSGRLPWLPLILGGIVGAILGSTLFDWALIILSSITGATLIVQSLHLRQVLASELFIVIIVVGIIIQFCDLHFSKTLNPPR